MTQKSRQRKWHLEMVFTRSRWDIRDYKPTERVMNKKGNQNHS